MITESLINSNRESQLDAIIVLGCGVVKNPDGYQPGHDGIWRTIAAVQSYEEAISLTKIDKEAIAPYLVFSGGRTLGDNHPSEAQVNCDFINNRSKLWQSKFPQIPQGVLILEETSKTTWSNIHQTSQIIDRYGWKDIGYLTSRYHVPYVQRLLRINGLTAHLLTSEDLMIRRNPDYQEMIDDYYRSPIMKKIMLTQTLLIALLMIDHQVRLPEFIASRTRR